MRELCLLFVILLFQNPTQAPALKNKTKNTEQNKQAAVQIAPVSAGVGSTHEESPTHDSKNTQAYDPRTDRLYRWYMRCTIIGVCGGIVGVIVLVLQIVITRKSVDAANKNARAFIYAERAWVLVTVDRYRRTLQSAALYDLLLKNLGNTPARIVDAWGDLRVMAKGEKLADNPSYSTRILPAEKMLAPKEEWSIRTFGPYAQGFAGTPPSDAEQVFIGYVTYRHVFDEPGTPPHLTRFCFRLQANYDWQATGPSSYHEYT